MRVLLVASLLLTIPGGAAANAGLPVAEPAAVEMDAAALARISKRMEMFVREGTIAGAVTLVARKGKVVHRAAVGQADIATDRPMTEETIFAIASMTKPVTATAVMILQDEGKLSLDDPVAKYVPEFADATLRSGGQPRPITLRDLLTHSSGLSGDQRLEGSLEESAKRLAKRPLDFQPGKKWQYSPGLTVCGRVVEVASGQPFARFLKERIFEPLGMEETTFRLTEEQSERLATLYKPSAEGSTLVPGESWLNDPDEAFINGPNPSGGLFSTAGDMARFYQMVLKGGQLDGRRIVSQASIDEMTQVQRPDHKTGFTPGNGWGLGWCVVCKPQGVTRVLSAGSYGHGGAFGTQGWVDPDRQLVIVLMIQRLGLPNSDSSEMRAELQKLAVGAVRK